MTSEEYEAEIARRDEEVLRLHAFILQVAQRLFLAAEVLAIRAEKRKVKSQVTV